MAKNLDLGVCAILLSNLPARFVAGFALKEHQLIAITIVVPPDVAAIIDQLRERELLTRAAWLGREVTEALRASRLEEMQTPEFVN